MLLTKRNDLGETSSKLIRRLFLKLLPVQALTVAFPAFNSLLSCFIIGNFIGPDALAAIAFSGPLTSALTAVSSMLALGAQMLCGQYLGKGNKKGVGQTFSSTVLLCLASGAVFTLVSLFFPLFLARILGAAGELLPMTADYIRGLSFGMVFTVLWTSLIPFLQLDCAPKVSSLSASVMAIVNITANLLNAFVFKLGIFGVGLSTSIANIASVLVTLPHFLFKTKVFRISVRDFNIGIVKRVSYLGFPSAISPLGLVLRDRVVNQLIFNVGGSVAMSALAVANNFSSTFGSPIEGGYTGSANLISSVLVGERDGRSLSELPRIMMRSVHYIYISAYILLFAFTKPLALLFGAEPENIAVYALVIRVFNLWIVTNTLKTPTICIYRALNKITVVSVLYVLNAFLFPTLWALAAAPTLGLAGIMFFPAVSEVLLVLTYALYYSLKTHKLPRSIAEITYIPEELTGGERFDAAITSLDEAVTASEQLIGFCCEQGISERTSRFCGLCVEEIAADTIRHGFVNSKRSSRTIDLRVICENGEVTMLLRDDCDTFDPTEWLALCAPEDPSRSVGIRMVSKLSEEMTYIGALGLNVLKIKL